VTGEPANTPWVQPADATPEGLVGVGGSLDVHTLLRAYSEGVFPWFNPGDPILWWSPDPRAIFELESFKPSKRLSRTIRSGKFRTTTNVCFPQVMFACGETRKDNTWISPEMVEAYTRLHALGFAHSVEVWQGADLVGGIYGVALWGLFAGESMFHTVTDASKVALVALVERLKHFGFVLFDTQIINDHTESMGAIEIPRQEYLSRLRHALELPKRMFHDLPS
jgi:leucyl/phenylalanyl-tRNA--protein transferase